VPSKKTALADNANANNNPALALFVAIVFFVGHSNVLVSQ